MASPNFWVSNGPSDTQVIFKTTTAKNHQVTIAVSTEAKSKAIVLVDGEAGFAVNVGSSTTIVGREIIVRAEGEQGSNGSYTVG